MDQSGWGKFKFDEMKIFPFSKEETIVSETAKNAFITFLFLKNIFSWPNQAGIKHEVNKLSYGSPSK